MIVRRLITLAMLSLPLLATSPLVAQVPRIISFQGVATDRLGAPLPDGGHVVTVELFEASTGGAPIWSETHSATTAQGLFSLEIGTLNPLTELPFDKPYFLSISVDGGQKLTPRTPLAAAPYALNALNGGVVSVNGATGALTLVGEGGTNIQRNGSTITISSTGSGSSGVTRIEGSDGTVEVANGTGPTVSLGISANSISSAMILDATITAADIAAGVVPTTLPPSGAAGGSLSGNYPNPTIANNAVTAAAVANDAITSAKIANGTITAADIAAGVIPSALPPTGLAAGALTGSYPNPAIATGAVTSLSIADGSITTADLAAGVIPTALPPLGPAAGALAGNYPNPTIAPSTVTSLSVADSSITAADIAPGVIPTALPPNGTAGGALSGSYPNPTLANSAVTSTTILDGTITATDIAAGVIPTTLPPSGAAGGDLTGNYPNPTVASNSITSTKIVDGSITLADIASGVIPTTLPPSGTAGGDLAGTYPNPTIAASAVTSTAIADSSITAADIAAGVIPATLPPSGTAGGDLAGTYPNPAVVSLRGRPVAAIAPTTGQVLGWNGTDWRPANSAGLALPYNDSASSTQAAFRVKNTGTGPALATGRGAVLFEGTAGATPTSGAGTRLMWIPAKSAFRAGSVNGTQWDDAAIGTRSFAASENTSARSTNATAMGYKTIASGTNATALGDSSIASGIDATATGYQTTASGDYTTAMGYQTSASGTYAVALGFQATAIGNNSFATGQLTFASGANSTAMGSATTAAGTNSLATGFSTSAGGANSTAMGTLASTGTRSGSFIYGDNSVTTGITSSANNRFEVRAQGIWFGTGNTITYPAGAYLATSTGAYLTTGGAWTNSSDRNRKTDVQAINRRKVLETVATMPVSAWRYTADGSEVRHIGPMAQDFHAAFGLNGGDSTHIATVDADGVALAAIGGLKEIVDEQQRTIEAQARENAELRRRMEAMERALRELRGEE